MGHTCVQVADGKALFKQLAADQGTFAAAIQGSQRIGEQALPRIRSEHDGDAKLAPIAASRTT